MASKVNGYNADYYTEGKERLPATLYLEKKALRIRLQSAEGERDLFWYYDKIMRTGFLKDGKAVVKYFGFPVQIIETDPLHFLPELDQRLRQLDRSWLRKAFGSNAALLIKIGLGLVAILSLVYFLLIPFLADRMARRLPVSYEIRLGNAMYSALQTGFDTDDERSMLLTDFFSAMNIETEYPVEITVVRSSTANAFAVPGGHIVVYDELLDGMDDYSQLAALIAHEYTHVSNRHSTRSVFRQLGSSMFLSIITGNAGSIAGAAVSQADNLRSLGYSRKLEKEADLDGLHLLQERKLDGEGFIGLFELLKKESEKPGTYPVNEWISSHPDLQKRIDYIRENLAAGPAPASTVITDVETLRSLFERICSKD